MSLARPPEVSSARVRALIGSVYYFIAAAVIIIADLLFFAGIITVAAFFTLIPFLTLLTLVLLGFFPPTLLIAITLFALLPSFLTFIAAVSATAIVMLILAIAAYTTTARRISGGRFEAARGASMGFGILGLILGIIIGGIFLILAHNKLIEVVARYGPIGPPAAPVVLSPAPVGPPIPPPPPPVAPLPGPIPAGPVFVAPVASVAPVVGTIADEQRWLGPPTQQTTIPQPSQSAANLCSSCGSELHYVSSVNKHYCETCKRWI